MKKKTKKAKPIKAWAILVGGKLDPWYLTGTKKCAERWVVIGSTGELSANEKIVRVEIREI